MTPLEDLLPAAATPGEVEEPATILVVDDTPANLSLLASVLSPRWRVQLAPSGAKALDLLQRPGRALPDLIVLDIMMPEIDGYAVCRRLKADTRTRHIPVLFLSALNQIEDEMRGFHCGGADFIHKPFNPATVLARVATQLDAKRWRDMLARRSDRLEAELRARLDDVDRLRDAALHVMISFAEFRHEAGSHHLRRTQEYVRTLACWLAACPASERALSVHEIDPIVRSVPLHDIGKVAIPDAIVLKPGPLTDDEMAVMKTHAAKGADMLGRAAQRLGPPGRELLRHGIDIARHHHERWDGTGYPDALAGAEIPLSARLMAVADVYDALISRRAHKAPMAPEQALGLIVQGSGSQFDPMVVRALQATHGDLQRIARLWNDDAAAAADEEETP